MYYFKINLSKSFLAIILAEQLQPCFVIFQPEDVRKSHSQIRAENLRTSAVKSSAAICGGSFFVKKMMACLKKASF